MITLLSGKKIVGKQYIVESVDTQEYGSHYIITINQLVQVICRAYANSKLTLKDTITGDIISAYHQFKGRHCISPFTKEDQKKMEEYEKEARNICELIRSCEGQKVKITGKIKKDRIDIELLENQGLMIKNSFE